MRVRVPRLSDVEPLARVEPVDLPAGTLYRYEKVYGEPGNDPPATLLHFHQPAEFVLFTHGSGALRTETGAVDLVKGDLVFVPEMSVHDFRIAKGEHGWRLLQVDPTLLLGAADLPDRGGVARLDAVAFERALMLFDWLGELERGPADETISLLAALAGLAARAGWSVGPAPSGPASKRFREVIRALHERPEQTLTLAAAAAVCRMSPAHFSRRFARLTGTGYAAYRRQVRIRLAMRRLASSDDPVSAIGYGLGFASPAHFCNAFRAEVGCSPRAFRAARAARSDG